MYGKITLEREEVYELCKRHVIGLLGSMPINYHLDCTSDYGTVTVYLERDKETEVDKNPVPAPPDPADLVKVLRSAPDDIVNTLKQIATIETE